VISLLLAATGLPAFAEPASAAVPGAGTPAKVDEPHALSRAKAEGKPVDVTTATTPTETL